MKLLANNVRERIAIAVVSIFLCGRGEAAELSSWLKPINCARPPRDMVLNEQLICTDPELRKADYALAEANEDKAKQLDAAQINALAANQSGWFLETCVGDRSGAHPLPAATAKACLRVELPKRRQFVINLPVDKPQVPYRLSRLESIFLKGRAGWGIINGENWSKQGVQSDAVIRGLRRVFTSVLPAKLDGAGDLAVKGTPLEKFVQLAYMDGAFNLGTTQYFIDIGQVPHSGSLEGSFIVDTETGEVTMAMFTVDELWIFEKACISPSFRDFSHVRFRQDDTGLTKDFAAILAPKATIPTIDEHIITSPCR